MYKKNLGKLDRLIRIVLAEILFILAWFWLYSWWQTVFYILTLIMISSAITGFCFIYKIFSFKTKQDTSRLVDNILLIIFLALAIIGPYYSSLTTKKIFLEDYNSMNHYYKLTLLDTGQKKRADSIDNYNKLIKSYSLFFNKYSQYHPRAIANDRQFNPDLNKVLSLISSLRNDVYQGDLQKAHLGFEKIRPIFQDILKRNDLSTLAVNLIDFHDAMERVINEANNKNANGVVKSYFEASNKLEQVEKIDNDSEIKNIRHNLELLLNSARSNDLEKLPTQAANLKGSYIKVYMVKG